MIIWDSPLKIIEIIKDFLINSVLDKTLEISVLI